MPDAARENVRPCLTAELPGTGGRMRERNEDFVVEEIPAYAPSGGGEHTYLFVEKTGISTIEAVRRMARALGVREGDFGYAGHKDARGVTRQWFSATRLDLQVAWRLNTPGLKLLDVSRHGNRLKTGHLAGNRFEILVRGVGEGAEGRARRILDVLGRRGLPNYFGEQRFGSRNDSDLIGRELVRGSADGALKILLGVPREGDEPEERKARGCFDIGDYSGALHTWPRRSRYELQALERLKAGAEAGAALMVWPKRMRFLFVSACQSRYFNAVLAERIASLDRVELGDLAFLHRNGAVFRVTDAATEAPRAEAFEISPSGPLFGYKVPLATGRPGEVEARILAESGIDPAGFKNRLALGARGERRALRVKLGEPSVAGEEQGGEHCLRLNFTLPAGSFATEVLREVTKS